MKCKVPDKFKLRFIANDDYSKNEVSNTGSKYLLDLTLKVSSMFYIYICMYIYIYTYVYMYINICIYAYIYMYLCIYIYLQAYTSVYTHFICTYLYESDMYIHEHRCILDFHYYQSCNSKL
jgi:hypothetical protein